MKASLWRNSISWLYGFCGAAFCLSATAVSISPNSAYFAGLDFSRVKREGFYDFPSIRESQPVSRSGLTMVGGSMGKRWKISKHLRFQVSLGYGAGSSGIDDTLRLSRRPCQVKYSFSGASLEPQVQLPLTGSGRVRPFLLLGSGVEYTVAEKRTFNLPGDTELVYYELPILYIRSNRVSLSGAAGFGLDWALARAVKISAWYAFRYCRPVRYQIREQFLLSALDYHETFFSHQIHLAALFDVR
jgi:hypothetical protein